MRSLAYASVFILSGAVAVGCTTTTTEEQMPAGSALSDGGTERSEPPSRTTSPDAGSDATTAAPPTLLFLNFEDVDVLGATSVDDEDATKNRTPILREDATLAGYAASQFALPRADVIARVTAKVQELFAPFNAQVVSKRPQAPLKYSMVMMTDETNGPNSFGASADIDCGNDNKANVSVVFANAILDNTDPEIVSYLFPDGTTLEENRAVSILAIVAAHELGHTMGLEDTDADDVMYPDPFKYKSSAFASGPVKDFVSGATTSRCTGKTTQDSHGILLGLLGARPAD